MGSKSLIYFVQNVGHQLKRFNLSCNLVSNDFSMILNVWIFVSTCISFSRVCQHLVWIGFKVDLHKIYQHMLKFACIILYYKAEVALQQCCTALEELILCSLDSSIDIALDASKLCCACPNLRILDLTGTMMFLYPTSQTVSAVVERLIHAKLSYRFICHSTNSSHSFLHAC